MFDGTYADRANARDLERTEAAPGRLVFPDHARLVREWTRVLSSLPGWRGYMIRMALISGWH